MQAIRKSALATLELPPDASNHDIKVKYRRLALKHHPDKVNGNSEEAKKIAHDRFSKISAAYELLMTDNCASHNNMNSVLYAPRFTDPYELFQLHNLVHNSHKTVDPIPNPFRPPFVAGYLTESAAPIQMEQQHQNKRGYFEHLGASSSPITEEMHDGDIIFEQNRPAKRFKASPDTPMMTEMYGGNDSLTHQTKRVKLSHDTAPPSPSLGRTAVKRTSYWPTMNQDYPFESSQKRQRMSSCA